MTFWIKAKLIIISWYVPSWSNFDKVRMFTYSGISHSCFPSNLRSLLIANVQRGRLPCLRQSFPLALRKERLISGNTSTQNTKRDLQKGATKTSEFSSANVPKLRISNSPNNDGTRISEKVIRGKDQMVCINQSHKRNDSSPVKYTHPVNTSSYKEKGGNGTHDMPIPSSPATEILSFFAMATFHTIQIGNKPNTKSLPALKIACVYAIPASTALLLQLPSYNICP